MSVRWYWMCKGIESKNDYFHDSSLTQKHFACKLDLTSQVQVTILLLLMKKSDKKSECGADIYTCEQI